MPGNCRRPTESLCVFPDFLLDLREYPGPAFPKDLLIMNYGTFVDKRCTNHPTRNALSFCHSCERFFCADCLTEAGDYYYCATPQCSGAKNAVLTEIDQAYLKYFCRRCIDMTTDESAGDLATNLGTGHRLLEKGNRCPDCGSVEVGEWFCYFYIPLFRLAKYRLVWLKRGASFLGNSTCVSRRLKGKEGKKA